MHVCPGKWSSWMGSTCVFCRNLPITVFLIARVGVVVAAGGCGLHNYAVPNRALVDCSPVVHWQRLGTTSMMCPAGAHI